MIPDPHQMCFGLNEDLDRTSISCFLQLLGREEFTRTLADRLSSDDIQEMVHFLTGILKKSMSEDEYHQLFLLEPSPHNHSPKTK